MDPKLNLDEEKYPEIHAEVKSLLGSLKVPEGFDYKEELREILSEKYLHE